jgi:uncharacterized protein YkwD
VIIMREVKAVCNSRLRSLASGALCIALVAGCAQLPAPASSQAGTSGSKRVLALVNEARAAARRCGFKRHDAAPPLTWSAVLERVALAHARDMAARSELDHAGSDGSTPGERATRAGYDWRTVGENIASGQRTAEQVVASWLQSPGHCANLMDADFTEMGVASAVAPGGKAAIYWVQLFAAPRG